MIWQLTIIAVMATHSTASTTTEESLNERTYALYQKMVIDLLSHIFQADKVHPEIYEIGTSWDIEANIDLYTDKSVVKEFLQRYRYGMLPKTQIFSVFYPHILDEAVALFRLFRSARDIQTFFKTASWARVYMNEGQFVYAMYLAVIHRNYGQEFPILLPLPYEIIPTYYFNQDVMRLLFDYKMADTCPGTGQPYIIMANYTNSIASNTRNPESKLSYFREDVGLSAYYFFVNHEFPFWMSSSEYKQLSSKIRGEFYYNVHKMLLNRYRMEQYSHGLDEIEDFDLNMPIVTGYTPALIFLNGLQFPQRPESSLVPTHAYGSVRSTKEFESRIMGAIDSGYYLHESGKSESIFTRKGFNMIGNVIEGNADSVHGTFYGSIDHAFRTVFGFSPEFQSRYEVVPSALQFYSTSLRDPAFYRIYKRILSYFNLYKQHMGYHTHDEIAFKGVEIDTVTIDEMSTYFNWTDSLISKGALVRDDEDAETFSAKARQYRLIHKPFTYHMNIKSDKKTKAAIRIFLGPKYNVYGKEYDISENYEYFYVLDYFTVNLTAGVNKVKRKSSDAFFTVPDYESGDVFYNRILENIRTATKPNISEQLYGFPNRLLLPKGTVEGLAVRLFFYVSEFVEESCVKIKTRTMGEWVHDGKPLDFPLDRPVNGFNFTTRNMLFKDTFVFHNDEGSVRGIQR